MPSLTLATPLSSAAVPVIVTGAGTERVVGRRRDGAGRRGVVTRGDRRERAARLRVVLVAGMSSTRSMKYPPVAGSVTGSDQVVRGVPGRSPWPAARWNGAEGAVRSARCCRRCAAARRTPPTARSSVAVPLMVRRPDRDLTVRGRGREPPSAAVVSGGGSSRWCSAHDVGVGVGQVDACRRGRPRPRTGGAGRPWSTRRSRSGAMTTIWSSAVSATITRPVGRQRRPRARSGVPSGRPAFFTNAKPVVGL